jgi:hypothetical protein
LLCPEFCSKEKLKIAEASVIKAAETPQILAAVMAAVRNLRLCFPFIFLDRL